MKRILIAKLRHHGDVLLSSPVFTALRSRYPEAQIDAYIYKETLPMLEGLDIDNYYLYDRKKGNTFSILKKIWKTKYDLAINLTEGDRGALAALVSRAKVRVGYDPDKKTIKNAAYTHMVRPVQRPRHTVEKNLDALRQIGIFPSVEERAARFVIPDSSRLSLLQKLDGISSFIHIHPVSRWLFKCWPEEKMIALCKELIKRGETIVMSAGPDPKEMAMVERICKEVPVHNLAGKLTLKELGALIDLSKLLICVDSVPLHIASALKAPTLALFGPTSDENWAPWHNPHARVLAQNISCRPCYNPGCGGSGRSDCMETLPVSTVLSTVDELLTKQLQKR